MERAFDIAIPIALLAVTATLFVGIYSLFRGGEFARTYSNKLMRLRVLLQAVTVVAILIAAFTWRRHGGP